MSSATLPAPASEKSLIERLLSPIADVRPGEGPVVLLLSLNLFLILLGYYLLKTVREALVLTESGAAVKTYVSAGQALCSWSWFPPLPPSPPGSTGCASSRE